MFCLLCLSGFAGRAEPNVPYAGWPGVLVLLFAVAERRRGRGGSGGHRDSHRGRRRHRTRTGNTATNNKQLQIDKSLEWIPGALTHKGHLPQMLVASYLARHDEFQFLPFMKKEPTFPLKTAKNFSSKSFISKRNKINYYYILVYYYFFFVNINQLEDLIIIQ